MARTLKNRIKLWWSFNNPRLLYKIYKRNKFIKEQRIRMGIPLNFEEIEKEFGKIPGFLLKYPDYFFIKQKIEQHEKRNYLVYISMNDIINRLLTFK